ncbi:MAG: FeoA family protein [Legionellaceae bacterium]|nr:FeoA family protein [Legionellaceae bacterium]
MIPWKPGQRLRLKSFGTCEPIQRQRLQAFGFTRGIEILIKGVAPLGCPIVVSIRETDVWVRKSHLARLHWELI